MEIATVLARFWGIVIIVLSAAMLVNRQLYRAMLDAKQDDHFVIVTGLISLVIGALQVSIFNVWEFSYLGLITLLGWLALIRGAIRLAALGLAKSAVKEAEQKPVLLYSYMGVSVLLGLYLIYASFA